MEHQVDRHVDSGVVVLQVDPSYTSDLVQPLEQGVAVDEELLGRLKEYSEELKNQVVAKADKLQEIGHKEYLKQK